jgi:hypothetical protein
MTYPRFSWLNIAWARELVQFWDQQLVNFRSGDDSRESGSPGLDAVRADIHTDLARLRYALGEPLIEVKQHITAAARAHHCVFAAKPTGVGSVDPTLKSSRRGLIAMAMAAIAGMHDELRETAEGVGEPPGATWVAEDSEICTPAEQRLAGLLRAEVLSSRPSAFVRPDEGGPMGIVHCMRLARTLIDRERDGFRAALNEAIEWYESRLEQPEFRQKPELFLALHELGLAALALRHGIIALADLPSDRRPFPVALLGL